MLACSFALGPLARFAAMKEVDLETRTTKDPVFDSPLLL